MKMVLDFNRTDYESPYSSYVLIGPMSPVQWSQVEGTGEEEGNLGGPED